MRGLQQRLPLCTLENGSLFLKTRSVTLHTAPKSLSDLLDFKSTFLSIVDHFF